MRLNKFIAHATGRSRREADDLISSGRVTIDGKVANLGAQITEQTEVTIDGKVINAPARHTTIMLHKPRGYVSSRKRQGDSPMLYDLLPTNYRNLKTVGRLDRDSSGLILLTSDGDMAHRMTHPRYAKMKKYLVKLDRDLEPLHHQIINDHGVTLPDGVSRLTLEKVRDSRRNWRVIMHEGRNRQIRRTFAALGYTVTELHRTDFGSYHLDNLAPGKWREIDTLKS